eukprot:CAMPEP_0115542372 /NCGR_PEP_ID=MMETSP0271-20121206/90953_1 /TAXON_ID=71861 /ORGANISM="Scrippsiella trochoidea, Strain CCMP3099" /LENGTH=175 /DNA_ID=CAMNT_0002975483 /DNA_START=32 /DNA_END=555 /DNA_ORIENTATION=-
MPSEVAAFAGATNRRRACGGGNGRCRGRGCGVGVLALGQLLLLGPTSVAALHVVAVPPTTPPPWGPTPWVVWIDSGVVSTTLPPLPENCFGCSCLHLAAESFIVNGAVTERYGCSAAASPMTLVPELRWSGITGAGRTFAVTIVDLDAPYGVGSPENRVQALFWAANIPGDWSEL